ncbi:MAG: ABC transporter permease [Chloroflexi bacterium]|nr:ABC transporter permease [Chloroflexota bacterium]
MRTTPARLAGFALVLAFVLVALAAPLLAGRDPLAQELALRLRPPALADPHSNFPLGSDALGRDLWSRLLYGMRTSLAITAASTVLATMIGVALGLLAGYRGGLAGTFIARWADIQQAIPYLILAVAVVAVLGSTPAILVLVLGLTSWITFFRVIRAQTLSLRESEFVLAARACGARDARILFRHLLPNLAGTIAVLATVLATNIIVFEAALGFLGLGVPPPAPSWGALIAEGRETIDTAWWLAVAPGGALALLTLGLVLLGDAE